MLHSLKKLLPLFGALGGIVTVEAAPAATDATTAATSTSDALPTTAAYFVSGSTTTFSSTTLTATGTNEGVIIVKETGVAYFDNVTFIKTGNSTSDEDSSFTDLNAAIGIETNGTVYITTSNIKTSGESANALHTYEDGATAYLTDVSIHAEGDGSHGIYTAGGTIYGQNLNVYTYDGHSSAIATDRGGGLIVVDDSAAYTYGALSALVYSTGNITTSSLVGVADIAPIACIDGSNSFTLINPRVSSGTQNNGVFQIVSTVATNGTTDTAYAYVTGGSVAETNGTYALIFVANIQAYVYVTSTDLIIKSGILANITSTDQWGSSGVNGGTASVFLTDVHVTGDIHVDDISSVSLYLINSQWTGSINSGNTSGTSSVYVDADSSWTLSGDSNIDSLGLARRHSDSKIHRSRYTLSYGKEVSKW